MTIQLTAEQEQRVQAVIGRGEYSTVQEVLDAALVAVEQWSQHGFSGTEEELDSFLAEGLNARSMSEDEFWGSVHRETDALLAEYTKRP